MSLWTWFGLVAGNASTNWPLKGGDDGQAGTLGMPRYDPSKCQPDCNACVEACVTHAISFKAGSSASVAPSVDWGRCIVCQMCTEVCPSDAFTPSGDWAVGVSRRPDLEWSQALSSEAAGKLTDASKRAFRRSLHIRHVDAGSCNGCESELQALNNPFYNLHRLGIFFTASPRFADLLLVTGPVTHAMRGPLKETYDAMPEPKWVMAMGTCAVSGGVSGGNYACGNGLDDLFPVDVYLPGCPPNPSAIIHALLLVVGRAEQQMVGGQIER
jgi:Ni,Fe-hydrogenase III small subunit/ferredoxin